MNPKYKLPPICEGTKSHKINENKIWVLIDREVLKEVAKVLKNIIINTEPAYSAYCKDVLHNLETSQHTTNCIPDDYNKADKNGWISVKDKLPPKGDNSSSSRTVLVFNKYSGVQELSQCHEFDEGYMFISCFSHWQPLPNDPKEKK